MYIKSGSCLSVVLLKRTEVFHDFYLPHVAYGPQNVDFKITKNATKSRKCPSNHVGIKLIPMFI